MFLVAVPARLMSSRIESKLLIEINGKPIIIHTLDNVSKAVSRERIHVFCDTEILVDIVNEYGYNGYLVDDKCTNGTERISKGITKYNISCEYVMVVNGDQPCLDFKNILTLVNFCDNSVIDKKTMYTLHTTCEDTEEDISVAKIAMTPTGKWLYISRKNIPSGYGNTNTPVILCKHASLCMFHIDLIKAYCNMNNTPLQLSEDNEWLKLLENGYDIKSCEVEYHERDLNTMEDLKYIVQLIG
jgi:3-deoxy-manno-octulosonate cytidylyltransferase (CMP-KDO synthetase)